MGKKVLTAAEILSKCVLREAEFDIGDGVIKVAGLSKETQQEARKDSTKDGEIDNIALETALFKAGVIDPKLTDEEFEQIKSGIPGDVFDKIVLKITELSGIKVKDVDKVKKP